ncbi:hypothetical protein COE23_05675 [Bacillus cereus]|nr:hypothetical protein COE23_05675 [Bacillus cereus]
MNSYFSKPTKCCRRLYPAFPPAVPIPESVTFMTWNIYQGFDVTPLFAAPPNQIPVVVTQVFRQFLATNSPVRAQAIAKAIALEKPDLIG